MEGLTQLNTVGPGGESRVAIKSREFQREVVIERVRNLLGDLKSVNIRA